MSEYIDRQKILEEAIKLSGPQTGDGWDNWGVYSLIRRQPVVDVVPVVRCHDCKYMTEHYDTDGNAPYWTCSEWDCGTDYDGFCHYGAKEG